MLSVSVPLGQTSEGHRCRSIHCEPCCTPTLLHRSSPSRHTDGARPPLPLHAHTHTHTRTHTLQLEGWPAFSCTGKTSRDECCWNAMKQLKLILSGYSKVLKLQPTMTSDDGGGDGGGGGLEQATGGGGWYHQHHCCAVQSLNTLFQNFHCSSHRHTHTHGQLH